jgi:CubicO group peptidase (beta-lactamase class C family)
MKATYRVTWAVLFALFSASLLPAPARAMPALMAGSEGCFPEATARSQGIEQGALDELCDIIQGYVDDGKVLGVEFLVIKNRFTVLHRTFGWKDYEGDRKVPMERGTIFNIRSMTKSVVGTAAQMLIDEGKLAPGDRVAKYIPAFDKEPCKAVTVEHLLTHRSGFPLGPLALSFHAFKNLFEVADRVAEVELLFEPGKKFQYSDLGADTLGAVVARASGKSLDVFLQERILDPLGMKDTLTLFVRDDPRAARVAPLFAGSKGAWMRAWKPYHPLYPFTFGSQSLYATPMDFARFMALWMDRGQWGGRRLLSEAAVRRGLTAVSDMDGYPTGFKGLKAAYARMWMVYIDDETPVESFGEAEPALFAHSGSDGTKAWAWPDQDLLVLYFSQSRGGITAIEIESDLERLLVRADTHRNEKQGTLNE